MAHVPPSSFLNPLAPIEWSIGVAERAGEAIRGDVESAIDSLKTGTNSLVTRAERDAAHGVRVVGQATGDATQPLAAAVNNVTSFLSVAVEDVKDIAKKTLLAETIFAAVSLIGIGATLWIASKQSSGGVTKILFGRAPSEGKK